MFASLTRRALVVLTAAMVALAGLVAPSHAAVGATTTFSLPAGATPFGVVLGPDGNLWVAGGASNTITKLGPDGTATNYPVPTSASNPRFITVGSDGNLWFTEQAGNKVGRITPAGTITEFPVPTAAAEPFAITPGPDGNLWFTELAGNKIGRITTAGVVTEFPVPTAAAGPYGIVAGPAGSTSMYFTESTGDKIGVITTAGAITETPLTKGASPRGIAVIGSAIWFAEFGTNKLAQLQGATVLEISLAANTQPMWLTQGPGPSIWLSMFGLGQVALLTASGSLQATYSLASGSQPVGLAQGADGNIWVAQSANGQVARVLSGQVPDSLAAPVLTPTTAAVNTTLSASTGTWGYQPTSYAYQWQRCTAATSGCTAISGATASTYAATAADSGQFLSVTVTATNLNGSSPAITSSAVKVGAATPVTPVTPVTPTAPVAVTLTVDAPAKTKRAKAKSYTAVVTPATANGTVVFTFKRGSLKKVLAAVPVANGSATVTWKPTRKWPTGVTKVKAAFVPTDAAAFTKAKGSDTVRVR